MRPSSWNGVGAIAKVPAASAVSFVMCPLTSSSSREGFRDDSSFKPPRRLLDLLFREEDLIGVGDDILGLPSRERRRPAFHFHHPQLADTAGAGDAERLAGLVARQFADHV